MRHDNYLRTVRLKPTYFTHFSSKLQQMFNGATCKQDKTVLKITFIII